MRYQLGNRTFADAVRLAWACSGGRGKARKWLQLLRFAGAAERTKFPLTGDDLIARGFSPGPRLGKTLQALEDWWLAQGFPDRQVMLARLDELAIAMRSETGGDDGDSGKGVEGAPHP
jgi:poly(A) polymerase